MKLALGILVNEKGVHNTYEHHKGRIIILAIDKEMVRKKMKTMQENNTHWMASVQTCQ